MTPRSEKNVITIVIFTNKIMYVISIIPITVPTIFANFRHSTMTKIQLRFLEGARGQKVPPVENLISVTNRLFDQ